MRVAIAALGLVVLGTGGAYASPPPPIADIVAAAGCAVGPPTRLQIAAAGGDPVALDALIAEADEDPQTVRTGEWIALPPSVCTIRPPAVRSEIRLDDPEVAALTSAFDAYVDFGDRGCYLDGSGPAEQLERTRGWDAEKANLEYFRFLAENLRTRNLTFFETSTLRTPPGFQILTGDCADVPDIDAIRQSQDLRDEHFDALIRADAPNVDYAREQSPSYRFIDLAQERAGTQFANAWMSF